MPLCPLSNTLTVVIFHLSALSAAAVATAKADGLVPVEENEPSDYQVTSRVEVLVIGGGTAGTIAAIQSGRMGAETMLVERGSQLGGTTTTGGVAYPGLFDAWGKQVIAGIGWELVRDCVKLDGGVFLTFQNQEDLILKISLKLINTYTLCWLKKSVGMHE